MRHSTIRHPALLAQPRVYEREAARLLAHARAPGLFDLPLPVDGPQGHTQAELEAIRAFDMLGQAFGLSAGAQAEWHAMVSRGDAPRGDGELLRENTDQLADLLLRAQTLAMYHDRKGQGAHWIRVWRRVRILRKHLQQLGDTCLLAQAVFAGAGASEVTDAMVHWVATSPGLYRELALHAPQLVQLMPAVHGHHARGEGWGGMRELRQTLLADGLTAAGWRWLVRNPVPFVTAHPWERQPQLGCHLWLANLLACGGADFVPSPAFASAAYGLAVEMRNRPALHARAGWFLRAAWAHLQSLSEGWQQVFLEAGLPAAGLWLAASDWHPDAHQRGAGWPAIERAWLSDLRQRSVHPGSWPVPFGSLRYGDLVAHALADAASLVLEGTEMGHCIENFIEEAACGRLLAFSVRTAAGERVATFTLQRAGADYPVWVFHQLSGPFNRPVRDPRVEELVRIVVERVAEGG
jgi:hypothetical protein